MASPSPHRRSALLLSLSCAAWLAFRLSYNAIRQLVPDEAYYWVWSRHLAAGYLDHPPMVAWVIRAGTTLLGTSEFSVRFGAALLTLGTILVVTAITRRCCADPRAALLAAAILLLSPLLHVVGMIITPDTPACFFSACALACALAVFPIAPGQATRGPWWLAFGVCMGLALLSKYTTVLLGVAILIALLCSSQGRREFAHPWAWLGALIAFAVFSPVVLWNWHHDWASFRFQLHHGSTSDQPVHPARNLLLYAAGQAAVWTPVLFVVSLVVLARFWRRFARLTPSDQILLLSATIPLAFFGVSSLRRAPEANWPMLAYLPLTVLIAKYVAKTWAGKRMEWVKIGIIVAACATVVLHVPEVLGLVPVRLVKTMPGKWKDLFGWREMGQAIDSASQGAPVFASTYETASEASFYMTGRPEVWTMNSDRPTEFDYLPGWPALAASPRAVFVRQGPRDPSKPQPTDPPPWELRQSFDTFRIVPWEARAMGRVLRTRQWVIASRNH